MNNNNFIKTVFENKYSRMVLEKLSLKSLPIYAYFPLLFHSLVWLSCSHTITMTKEGVDLASKVADPPSLPTSSIVGIVSVLFLRLVSPQRVVSLHKRSHLSMHPHPRSPHMPPPHLPPHPNYFRYLQNAPKLVGGT